MKRFTILLTTLLSVLALSAVFQAWADSRAEEKKVSAPVQVYDATGAMLEAINSDENVRISPVYDSTGAMLDAINPKASPAGRRPLIVYDATGSMLDAINP
jgi:hypothetical protein